MILAHAGVDFEDQHPGDGDVAAWADLKAEFPQRGGLPWYTEDDGKVYSQSMAIIRHLARKHGYVSDDPWKTFESDWVLELTHDTRENMKLMAGHKEDATDEAKEEGLTCARKLLDGVEGLVKDGRKYIGGDKPCAADF